MWWKIRLFLLYKTSNGCHQATHNILFAHFEYPDSKIKTDILWIRIFVSALLHLVPKSPQIDQLSQLFHNTFCAASYSSRVAKIWPWHLLSSMRLAKSGNGSEKASWTITGLHQNYHLRQQTSLLASWFGTLHRRKQYTETNPFKDDEYKYKNSLTVS